MRLRPTTWPAIADALARHLTAPESSGASPGDSARPHARLAVDAADAADPAHLAGLLAENLPALGRPAVVIAASGFLLPASIRLEEGRRNPDAYADRRLDEGALWREVFDPTEPGGGGRILPDLWDPVTDRATRTPYTALAPGTVVILHGPLLLGRWFPFDLTVHIRLSAGALERRTPPGERWTLPAFERYERDVSPEEIADVVVRADDPRRPAWSGPPKA